jgi:hypothetical protein
VRFDDRGQQRRCETRTRADAREYPTIGFAAFMHGDPPGHELVGRGIDHRFAHSQPESHQDERNQCMTCGRRNDRGQRGEYAPPQHPERQDVSWSEAHRQPAGGNLKSRVPDQECAEDPAQLNLAQAVLLRKCHARNGNVGAVEEGDRAEKKQHEH